MFIYFIYFVIMYTNHTILDFNLICIFELAFKFMPTSFKFSFFSSRLILSICYRLFSSNLYSFISCAFVPALTLLFSWVVILSTALLTISLFYWCLLNFLLLEVLYHQSLVGLILAYLKPKSPRSLHSYDWCSEPCIVHMGLDLSFVWSKYIFLRFT